MEQGWKLATVGATVGAVIAIAAGGAAAAGGKSASFTGKASVVDVDAVCIARGKDKGSVYVDVAVRYADASAAAAQQFAGGSHRVESEIEVLGSGGRVLARDRDRGQAQVDIPEEDSYVHTHQHKLNKRESKRVLDGKTCTSNTSRAVRLRIEARQHLRAASGSASARAAADSQATAKTVMSAVDGASSAPQVANGCVYDAKGQIDCSGAFLQLVSFTGERLPYGNFSFANMLGADLSGVPLGHVIMNQTILDQANLSGAEMGSASLTSASLIATNLTGALLPFANLANARFAGAELAGADLTGANLVGTTFENTHCDPTTKFPAAFGYACENGAVVKK